MRLLHDARVINYAFVLVEYLEAQVVEHETETEVGRCAEARCGEQQLHGLVERLPEVVLPGESFGGDGQG